MAERCPRVRKAIQALQRGCTPKKGRALDISKDISAAFESIRRGYPCDVAETFVQSAYWKSTCKRRAGRPPGVRLGSARTYAQARRDILDYLASHGWSVKSGLKTPHATSPDGDLRLWFRPQAVWYTRGRHHSATNARTIAYDLDIRTVKDVPEFVNWAEKTTEGR